VYVVPEDKINDKHKELLNKLRFGKYVSNDNTRFMHEYLYQHGKEISAMGTALCPNLISLTLKECYVIPAYSYMGNKDPFCS
jgi:hypothetical protein